MALSDVCQIDGTDIAVTGTSIFTTHHNHRVVIIVLLPILSFLCISEICLPGIVMNLLHASRHPSLVTPEVFLDV